MLQRLKVSINISKQIENSFLKDIETKDFKDLARIVGVYLDNDDISINIIITRLGNIVQNHQTIINLYDNAVDEVYNYLIQLLLK